MKLKIMLLLGFMTLATPAFAGVADKLKASMETMADGATLNNAGDSYNAHFGSLTVRFSYPNTNIMSFNSPTVKAGCGGVSVFGGSLSMISGDQLIKNIENIATAAIEAYAYDIALSSTCETCKKVLDALQAIESAANKMLGDRCALFNSMKGSKLDALPFSDSFDSWGDTAQRGLTGDDGKDMTDDVASLGTIFAGAASGMKSAINSTADKAIKFANDSPEGWLWSWMFKDSTGDAIVASRTCDMLNAVAGIDDRDCIGVIGSLVGRKYNDGDGKDNKPTVNAPLLHRVKDIIELISGSYEVAAAPIRYLDCGMVCTKADVESMVDFSPHGGTDPKVAFQSLGQAFFDALETRYDPEKGATSSVGIAPLNVFQMLMLTAIPADVRLRLQDIYRNENHSPVFNAAAQQLVTDTAKFISVKAIETALVETGKNIESLKDMEQIKAIQKENIDISIKELKSIPLKSKSVIVEEFMSSMKGILAASEKLKAASK